MFSSSLYQQDPLSICVHVHLQVNVLRKFVDKFHSMAAFCGLALREVLEQSEPEAQWQACR